METAESSQILAGRWDIAGGVFRFIGVLVRDAVPGWAKWTIGGLLAFAVLWEAGKWLRGRRSTVR
ncbi:hypothetical protein HET69_06665 [Streptomyces sp. CJ_13]|uniref:hypothetical protein n=1 Tax=Streptomyces TaxID=1883 RepID=UPI000F3A7EED|nr:MULTISPECIES: hypothetical protein [unclassified Streptomyces]AYV26761.1 hypothetical protein EES41_08485 [Streptomyces sp. ADI95-16]MBT1183703.1 hypothetical protein [Streptomyces sp. CJ_13]